MGKLVVIMDGLSIGGAEVQTVDLLNELCKIHEILLLNLGSSNMFTNRISPRIQVVCLGKKTFLDFGVLKKIAIQMNQFKPDTMLFVNPYSMMYGHLASKFIKYKPYRIVILHTTILRTRIEELKNIYYKRVMNRMDRIVFVCHNQKRYWQKRYRISQDKSVVIYNGIDRKNYEDFPNNTKLKKELNFKDTDIIIGINAILRPEKKHEHAIDALEMLVNKGYCNVKLLFIGDGVQRPFLEEYIAKKHLQDYIFITGYQEDVRPYLSCMDISVLTSTSVETLSIAILESMAMGKTIVLSNIGGASELVEQGVNGFVYPAGNVGELFFYLKTIIEEKMFIPMGEESKRRVGLLFDKATMIRKYNDLISNKTKTVS